MLLAALATLSFGVVLGPEAPLILIGSGLGVLAVRLAARDAPDQAATVIAAAGSFAAISSLLGSPILGAFLLLEAAGLGGPMLGVVLVPGLLAAGIGTLIFLGLDELTGFGTFSLAFPGCRRSTAPRWRCSAGRSRSGWSRRSSAAGSSCSRSPSGRTSNAAWSC